MTKLSKILLTSMLLFIIVAVLSSCTVFTKKIYIVPELENSLFVGCKKPTTVLNDLNVIKISELSKIKNDKFDSIILESYAQNKNEYISCYKTLLNVQTTYNEIKHTILITNK